MTETPNETITTRSSLNAWYNEIEPYAAQWIENLAAAGHIAAGPVDRRSIVDLVAADVPGGRQCHFFAGIGGWSYALRLARWPDDLPVWTGSCPCQPFSTAGRKEGFDDARHLWPDWFRLIEEHRPAIVFGEQVASPAGLDWFDLVSSDLERAGYEVGAADLCAAGIGAPHLRQRLYWVAIARGERLKRIRLRLRERGSFSPLLEAGRGREVGNLANSERRGATRGFWFPADWIDCRDDKWRPIEPGTFPLAHGVPARVGRLRGYGNAINPEVGAVFVKAVMDWLMEAA